MNDEEMTKLRIRYYFSNPKKLHITTKKGTFYNGTILQLENEDYFIFNDFKLGEVPIFYVEIKRVEAYTPK